MKHTKIAAALLHLLGTVAISYPLAQEHAPVDLAAVFAPPSRAELEAVEASWSGRDMSAKEVVEEEAFALTLGEAPATLRVVSHVVGGERHYGAIVAPDGATPGSLPVLVLVDGCCRPRQVNLVLGYATLALGDLADRFVFVIPAFRGEVLTYRSKLYWAEDKSDTKWQYSGDVDDALALLNVALETTPAADPERIGIFGASRGGFVALAMAERDPRVDLVVEHVGWTTLLDPLTQAEVEGALATGQEPPSFTSLVALDIIRPLVEGRSTVTEVRQELLLHSPLFFAGRLPLLQLHHGTSDTIVPVGQAEALIEALERSGRAVPDFEAYLYEGAGHLLGSSDLDNRTRAFLSRLLRP
jgi:fermentation-respiration switch protein FrsA (DUF1100 family)